MQFENLFSPIKIGTKTARNRIVLPCHGMPCLPFQEDFDDGSTYLAYQVARAKGGCGLSIVGPIICHNTGVTSGALAHGLSTPEILLPKLKKLGKALHEYNTLVLMQMYHSGDTFGGASNSPNWGFSANPINSALNRNEVPHEMTDGEINEIINGFVNYAKLAVEAGMDGIEIHGAHGYLVQQSWSSWSNRRTDKWGERTAFIKEVVSRIRTAIGKENIISVRMPGDDFYPGPEGVDIEKNKQTARALEASGNVDMISISAGYGGNSGIYMVSNMYIPPGSISIPLASGIKQAVKSIPVVAGGRINDPALADKAIADGHCDMVGMVRAHIADPEFGNKAREGRAEDIRLCIGCNQGCYEHATGPGMLYCTQNYVAGRETTEIAVIKPAPKKKKVMVIGGGPGGMEAARVAALRGHDVTLYEKSSELGGLVNLLSKAPGREEFNQVTRYLTIQLPKVGVKVKLNTFVTPEMVTREKPDAVIVATGSRVYIEPVPGAETSQVVSPIQILRGEVNPGKKVVVYECTGYQEGPTVADYLGEKGIKVELVTFHVTIGLRWGMNIGILSTHVPLVWQSLRKHGVNVTVHSKVKQISGRRVTLAEIWTGEERIINDVDTVVIATGYLPDNALYKSLESKVKELSAVGDCVTPKRALDAIHSGYRTGFYI